MGNPEAELVEPESVQEDVDTVDPWNVKSTSLKGVDYNKLIGTVKSTHFLFSLEYHFCVDNF
jgi:hypothetical protein